MVHPYYLEMARKEKSAVAWAEDALKNSPIDKDKGRQKPQLVHHLSMSTSEDVCARSTLQKQGEIQMQVAQLDTALVFR